MFLGESFMYHMHFCIPTKNLLQLYLYLFVVPKYLLITSQFMKMMKYSLAEGSPFTLRSCSYHYGFLRCFQSNIVIGEMINVFYPILGVVLST